MEVGGLGGIISLGPQPAHQIRVTGTVSFLGTMGVHGPACPIFREIITWCFFFSPGAMQALHRGSGTLGLVGKGSGGVRQWFWLPQPLSDGFRRRGLFGGSNAWVGRISDKNIHCDQALIRVS